MYEDEETNGIFYNPWVLNGSGTLVRCPHFGKITITYPDCPDYKVIGCRYCIHRDDEQHTKWNMRLQLWKLGYGRNDSARALSLSAIYKQEEINQLIADKQITYAEIGIEEPGKEPVEEIGVVR